MLSLPCFYIIIFKRSAIWAAKVQNYFQMSNTYTNKTLLDSAFLTSLSQQPRP
jgi:hypothetical protein